MSSDRLLPRLALTAAAAGVAETATYPIDAVKTQLQLQGSLQQAAGAGPRPSPPPHLGAWGLARCLVASQGLVGLYAGLPPAVLRHVFYTGTRIAVYERLRAEWAGASAAGGAAGGGCATNATPPGSPGGGTSAGGAPPLGAKLAMGLTAGAIGQLVALPADLIKVRMQADAQRAAAGLQAGRRYRRLWQPLAEVLRTDGPRGLWRGAAPAVQRAALVNLGELSTYDSAKRAVAGPGRLPEGPLAHAAASVCSGLVAALVSTPADVVKTRLMAGAAAAAAAPPPHAAGGGRPPPLGAAPYRGSWDCLRATVRGEGWGALYKGFWPTWARLGPWQLVFWTVYEAMRQTAGMAGF